MSRQYEHWLLSQEEPQLVQNVAGRARREPTALQEKWRLEDEMRALYGEEEYQRKIQEWQQDEARRFTRDN